MTSLWQAKNRGVAAHPLVRSHANLSGARIVVGARHLSPDDNAERIGWGYKASGLWAREAPDYRIFEDGFVRSLRPGYGSGALYSLVEDRAGIYYDGNGESDLVEGLNGGGRIGEALSMEGWEREAELLQKRFTDVGASKYNWFEFEHRGPSIESVMPEKGILVVDQTAGDAAIRFGKGGLEIFEKMLMDAVEEASGDPVYLRTHPDADFRSRKSCFSSELLRSGRVQIVPSGFAPYQVFPRVSRVHVFNSLLGMEALLHGCDVRVYGCPFYAGWGLTDDRHPDLPERRRSRSLTELFYSAYQLYSLYFDPNFGEPCSFDYILDHLERQKEIHASQAGPKLLFGFPKWKARLVSRFLTCPGEETVSTRSLKKANRWIDKNPEGEVYTWSVGKAPKLNETATRWSTEDGFLRSVGLGSDFHSPVSLVFDSRGIYFDAGRASDLERILQESKFSEDEIRQAGNMIQYLIENRITKYNLEDSLPGEAWPEGATPRILVPGQVEADASLTYGSVPCRSNLEFLRLVREKNPTAFIAFKPHPDLVKRLRPGEAIVEEMSGLCDVLISGLDINPWLESCDEVHTLTSQTGFEAILRGRKVTCYGIPFYAGWGLTTDMQAPERRHRKLSVEELVAGVLLRYPRYLNPSTHEFTNALEAAANLHGSNPEDYSRSLPARAAAAAKRWIHPFR